MCVCVRAIFLCYIPQSGRRGRDRVVVGLTAYAINAYHHSSCAFEFLSWRCVLGTTLCDKFCQ